jgi:serine/threonine protein kinase
MIGRTISHYRITEKLGEGGMGVVYKAEDTELDRPVALKFLPAHLLGNADIRKRFEREAKAAAALHHPNICPVFEIDETEGRSFISMAFIDGESLDKKIVNGPLKLEQASDIAQQIARGLDAAHKKGIFHRDIKPENLIVDDGGNVTILDFGLAQLTQASRLTRDDTTLGTVAYMSPEQTEGSGTDHRTDIWSLGIVLYEMITGQQPFKGDYDKAVMYSILNEEPKPVRKVRVDAPEELEEIVRRALAKDRAVRYPSASEMAAALEARRASLFAPSRREIDLRWLWRSARRPSVTAPALLILLALAGVSAWWVRKNSQVQWARQTALPEAHRLADQGDYDAAWALAVQAENHVPEAPQLLELWGRWPGAVSNQEICSSWRL